MKRFSRVVTYLVMSTLLLGGVASAAPTASIENTGPGSNNSITITDECKVKVTNTNTVDGSNSSTQTSSSGTTTSSGNTTGGSASSGSAINSNTIVVDVVIENSTPASCDPVIATTPGGSGGGQVEGISTVVGGRGGGEIAGTQVEAPVGGVGAGAGGIASSLFAASILSGAVGIYRLRKSSSLKI